MTNFTAKIKFSWLIWGSCFLGLTLVFVVSISFWRPNRGVQQIENQSIAASLLTCNGRYQHTDGVARRGWSMIHRLDADTALRIEKALRRSASRTSLPANYLAAYVQQESTGDPRAEFQNTAKWEAAKDDRERFAATDHGLVQISGRNLLDQFPTLSLEALKAKAEDIDFATDFLADYVQKELAWASSQKVAGMPSVDKSILIKAENPYWLAALSYNRGRNSALETLSNPRGCRHADLIINAWAQIDATASFNTVAETPAPIFPASEAMSDDPRKLAKGDIGPGVEALQRLLNDKLLPSPQLKVDGNFGPATRAAVIRLQTFRNLEANGTADSDTWKALIGSTVGDHQRSPLVMGDKGSRVADLQRTLNHQLDLKPALATDGKFGPATRDAIIRFQRSQKIDMTGAADAATHDALDSIAKPN